MVPVIELFRLKRVIGLRDGGSVVLVMDLYEIHPEGRKGLFLEKYRLSWVAFDSSDVDRRVLFDSHPPVGLHYHVDSGPQLKLEVRTVEDALRLFEIKVTEYFGELEERIYEDLHF